MSEDDPYVALVVQVPDDYFSDEDDICLRAALHVCGRLETYLVNAGHTVEDWVKGGCAEDWGAVFESIYQGRECHYAIHYFPNLTGQENLMAVQFDLGRKKQSWWKSLRSPAPLEPAPKELVDLMEGFGSTFQGHRMLTKSQFDREY